MQGRLGALRLAGGSHRATCLSGPALSIPPLSGPAAALMSRLEGASAVGLVHLALPCDGHGIILTWSSEVTSVAEPSESASLLLESAVSSIGWWNPALRRAAAVTTNASVTTATGSAAAAAMTSADQAAAAVLPSLASAGISSPGTAPGGGVSFGASDSGPGGAAPPPSGLLPGHHHHRRCATSSSLSLATAQRAPDSLWDLVHLASSFVVDGVMFRFQGCHTQMVHDNLEVRSYLFSKTMPADRLTAEDIRWMASCWRDRIIVCTGRQGPPLPIINTFLEAGARAVIAPPPHGSPPLLDHPAFNSVLAASRAAAAVSGASPAVDSSSCTPAMGQALSAAAAAAVAVASAGAGRREDCLDDVEAWIGREDRVFGLAVDRKSVV